MVMIRQHRVDHDGSNIKRALCHNNSLDSSLMMNSGDQQEFLAFGPDKNRFVSALIKKNIRLDLLLLVL